MIALRTLALAGVATAALASSEPTWAQRVDYSGSIQYASGDYLFPERSDALFFYNGLGMTVGRVRLSASLPLVYQRTPWIIYTDITGTSGTDVGPGGMQDVMGTGTSELSTVDTISYQEVGLGDPLLRVDLRLLGESGPMPSVRVTFDVKAPVGDVERGFSSGEWDYAGGVSLAKSVGATLLFADLAYWYLGDMPGVDLKNSYAYGAGVGRTLGDGKLGLLASIFGNTRIQPVGDPPVQVSLGLSYLLDVQRSLLISASAGLTDTAPDISFAFGWSIRF